MSYRTIVLHLDDGERCAERTALAIAMAARFGSRLIGVAAAGSPDVTVSVDTAVPDQVRLVAMSAAALAQRAAAVARRFEERCLVARVGSFDARATGGEALDAVVCFAQCSDLVIVGQSDRSAPVQGVAFDFPQQVLLQGGTPVLLVPRAGSFAAPIRRMLIAWKERPEATRAVRDALPLLRVAEHVTLCCIADERASDSSDRLEPVQVWLATHGVRAQIRQEAATDSVGERLLRVAADDGSDAIVAGGYGHSRLREWALGGVTRHLLGHATRPILLSH